MAQIMKNYYKFEILCEKLFSELNFNVSSNVQIEALKRINRECDLVLEKETMICQQFIGHKKYISI